MAFGDTYGLKYQEFMQNKTVAPIVQMHLDYKIPLRFDEEFQIRIALHWSDAARLNFSYCITNAAGAVTTTGYTVQLLTDQSGEVLLVVPPWIEDFRYRWRQGLWSN
jgi:acyl-CoA thioester hydrolase